MATQQHIATETERIPSAEEIVKLEESFQLFTRTTLELENSYKKLTRKANRIDIELKRTNEELYEKVEELGALSDNRMSILEALPNGIVVIDPCRTISSVNPAAERILGRRALELVGRTANAVVGPTGDLLLIPGRTENSTSRTWEREIVALDGSRRQVAFTVANLPDGCELQVLTDLTVVTRLREQVGRLDTMAALGEMAAGVAHEIRNPLNGIDGFAGLLTRSLEDTTESEPLVRYAKNIRRGVREVNDIITNLLTFAGPESIQLNPVDLPSLVSEVVASFSDRTTREIDLKYIENLNRRAVVAGDAVKLKIICSNLIQNAIQAVGQEGKVAVSLTLSGNGKSAVLKVNDNGGGIAVEVRDRLFQPFCTTKASGTGLGLAIANKFAALHRAEISCHDIEGGTSFVVSVPLIEEEAQNHA